MYGIIIYILRRDGLLFDAAEKYCARCTRQQESRRHSDKHTAGMEKAGGADFPAVASIWVFLNILSDQAFDVALLIVDFGKPFQNVRVCSFVQL